MANLASRVSGAMGMYSGTLAEMRARLDEIKEAQSRSKEMLDYSKQLSNDAARLRRKFRDRASDNLTIDEVHECIADLDNYAVISEDVQGIFAEKSAINCRKIAIQNLKKGIRSMQKAVNANEKLNSQEFKSIRKNMEVAGRALKSSNANRRKNALNKLLEIQGMLEFYTDNHWQDDYIEVTEEAESALMQYESGYTSVIPGMESELAKTTEEILKLKDKVDQAVSDGRKQLTEAENIEAEKYEKEAEEKLQKELKAQEEQRILQEAEERKLHAQNKKQAYKQRIRALELSLPISDREVLLNNWPEKVADKLQEAKSLKIELKEDGLTGLISVVDTQIKNLEERQARCEKIETDYQTREKKYISESHKQLDKVENSLQKLSLKDVIGASDLLEYRKISRYLTSMQKEVNGKEFLIVNPSDLKDRITILQSTCSEYAGNGKDKMKNKISELMNLRTKEPQLREKIYASKFLDEGLIEEYRQLVNQGYELVQNQPVQQEDDIKTIKQWKRRLKDIEFSALLQNINNDVRIISKNADDVTKQTEYLMQLGAYKEQIKAKSKGNKKFADVAQSLLSKIESAEAKVKASTKTAKKPQGMQTNGLQVGELIKGEMYISPKGHCRYVGKKNSNYTFTVMENGNAKGVFEVAGKDVHNNICNNLVVGQSYSGQSSSVRYKGYQNKLQKYIFETADGTDISLSFGAICKGKIYIGHTGEINSGMPELNYTLEFTRNKDAMKIPYTVLQQSNPGYYVYFGTNMQNLRLMQFQGMTADKKYIFADGYGQQVYSYKDVVGNVYKLPEQGKYYNYNGKCILCAGIRPDQKGFYGLNLQKLSDNPNNVQALNLSAGDIVGGYVQELTEAQQTRIAKMVQSDKNLNAVLSMFYR